MKNIYNHIILGFLVLLMFSCYKDNSTLSSDFKTLDQINIKFDKNNYEIIRGIDTLKISPNVSVNNKNLEKNKAKLFEYFWAYYEINKENSEDTIKQYSKEKNIKQILNIPPGNYDLIFGVRNIETKIVKSKKIRLNVITQTSKGWYLLKEGDNASTELDFYYETGGKLFTNIIAENNNGYSMEGKPVSLGIDDYYTYFDFETNKKNNDVKCIVPISENDLAMIRIADIKKLDNYKNLFNPPITGLFKPMKYIISGISNKYIFNNGKAYRSITRTKFGHPIKTEEDEDYSLSKNVIYPKPGHYINSMYGEGVCSKPMMFETKHSAFCFLEDDELFFFKQGTSTLPNKNINSDILYMDFYFNHQESAYKGIALLKEKSGDEKLKLFYLDLTTYKHSTSYIQYYATPEEQDHYRSNPVYKIDIVNSTKKLASADFYSIHGDEPLLYFTKNNIIYSFNIETKEEKNIKILDGGTEEKITYIKHCFLHGKDQYGSLLENKDEYLIVASSFSNGNYKVYMFEYQGGVIKNVPKITIEGKGKIKDMHFVN